MSELPPTSEFESAPDAYSVKLDSFEGPLDLLIHLIKKHEVNIYDIPIALITQQYLEYVEMMKELNLDTVGEFLVMAATLIHIKSKLLLPRPETAEDSEPEEDPRDALVRRLLEHQKFKAAAELLHERAVLRGAQWIRPDGRIAAIAGDEYALRARRRGRPLQPARGVSRRAGTGETAAENAAAAGRSPGRGAHRAAAGAAVGNGSVRVRGAVRRR